MSNTELILTALTTGATAGAAAGVTASTTAAITDSYEGLKGLLVRKLSALGRKDTTTIIEDSGTGSQEFRTQFVELLEASGAARDEEVITAANTLLALAGSEPGGKYTGMDVHDNKGLQVGDNNTQDNTFLLGVHVHPPKPNAVVPRQLPAAVPYFVARNTEAETLTELVGRAASGGTMVISAIDGTAGIGKTALALRWANQIIDEFNEFPDGQLYVNLRGFGPTDDSIMDPAAAVRVFLDAFDIPPERIPVSLEAQAALYRSLVADKRILIVLDNARDAEQVRPLLPGAKQCVVLVTSRNQLESLVALEGAHPLTLDLLTEDDAWDLLAARLGADRLAAESEAAASIIASCARLPLALAIVAARAAIKPRFPLHTIAAQLQESRGRVSALSGGDSATNLRAVLSWSYNTLSPAAARMFRMLGLHPGPDISAPAAASMAGISPAQSQALLDQLERANLLNQHIPERYAFHDLLRDYATDLAHDTDAEELRQAATHRVLDHYLHTAYTAALLLHPAREAITLASPQPGVTPQVLADYGQAMNWFTTEHAVLLAGLARADEARFDTHVWKLAWTLADFLYRRGHWHEQVNIGRIALAAAGRLADPVVEARPHQLLAVAFTRLGQFDDAHTHARHVLDLSIQASDQTGQALAHHNLAYLRHRQGNHTQALYHAQQALDLSRLTGHRAGQARALNAVGWHHGHLGEYPQALAACQQALILLKELDDRQGLASTWDSLGYIHHHLGDYPEAITSYQHSLDLLQDLGDRYEEATTLTNLADTHHAAGALETARDAWQEALTILEDLQHPDADKVRSKLADDTEL